MGEDESQAILIERSSKLIAEAIRPRLKEYEREQDRLIGELRGIKDYVRRIEQGHATEMATATALLEAEEHKVDRLMFEQQYQYGDLPGYVDLPDDAGTPATIVFDLHGTLTPARGFPITDAPYEGVKECLDEWAGQGCVIVIATGALDPAHPRLVIDARMRLAWEFVNKYALPVRYITGKVNAHLYLDDRMVPLNSAVANPWAPTYDRVVERLKVRAELSKDGVWRLIPKPDRGDPIRSFPDYDEVPADQPRGFSTPILDVDVHRCLLVANTSKNDSGLMPGALEVVTDLYNAGYTIHPSCAGWDPSAKDYQTSGDRLRGIQRSLRRERLPYDEIAAKMHGTVFVDDKGMLFTDWEKDGPEIRRRLATPSPDDEVTAQHDVTEPE